VRDDVVHLARDPSPFRGCRELALAVAFALEPRGALMQRRDQHPPLSDHDAEQRGGHHKPAQPDPCPQRITGGPPRGRQDRSQLGDQCG
jgi:hypothetical protein